MKIYELQEKLFFRNILQFTLEAQRVKITREHKNSYIYYFERYIFIRPNEQYTIYNKMIKMLYYIHDNL